MISGPPPGMQHSYVHMRSGVFPAAGNTSAEGLATLGTHTALMLPKLMVIQDNAGAPVMTADAEMYFMPGIPFRVNDALLDQGDGTRWRIVKIFGYPAKTIVWAARSES